MKNRLYTSCKICDSRNLARLFVSAKSGLPILQCSNCGLVFVGYEFSAPEQEAFYNNLDVYTEFAKAERSVPQVAVRYNEWAAQIKTQFYKIYPTAKQLPRLFDVGCGAGDFLAVARACGFNVRGQELSSAAARIAAEWNDIHVEVKPLAEIETDSTDCLTMIGLLEHVLGPREIIEEAHRIIKGQGLLFIYTPVWGAYDVLATLLARSSRNRITRFIDRRINQAHLQIFPKQTLIRFLQIIGFETLSCEVVCEYNLPVEQYLLSIGVKQPFVQSLAITGTEFMIRHKLFFRNNIRILAQKSAPLLSGQKENT